MHIVAWNIRAGGGKRVEQIFRQLEIWQPDVVAFSEYRWTPPGRWLAAQLAASGWPHQRGAKNPVEARVNQVFLTSRWPLRTLSTDCAPEEPGRWLMVNVYPEPEGFEPFRLGVMHIPNQVTGRKPQFHQAVIDIATRWQKHHGVLIGDTNSGQIDLDEQSPVFNRRTHAWFDELSTRGWTDAYRHLHGPRKEFTWYSPNKGNGFRLDQAFVSRTLQAKLAKVQHAWGGMAERRDLLSDHAAVIVDLH